MESQLKYDKMVCKTEPLDFVNDRLYECLTKKKHCPYRVAFGDSGFCTHPNRSQFTIDSSYRYSRVHQQ